MKTGLTSRGGWLCAISVLLVCAAGCRSTEQRAIELTGGDPGRGRQALNRYGCVSCHTIPGIRHANALVGPPLTRMGARVYVAGELPNTPDNLMRWIRDPRAVSERTAMPDTGVTEEDARHIAAYLYTLH